MPATSPSKPTRAETQAFYERHTINVGRPLSAADWAALADQFAADATYYDAYYGRFHGREAIRAFLERAMGGFETWEFPVQWAEVGEGRVVAHLMNRAPGRRADGSYFEFPSVSCITYDHSGQVIDQMDLYDCLGAMKIVAESKSGVLGRGVRALTQGARRLFGRGT